MTAGQAQHNDERLHDPVVPIFLLEYHVTCCDTCKENSESVHGVVPMCSLYCVCHEYQWLEPGKIHFSNYCQKFCLLCIIEKEWKIKGLDLMLGRIWLNHVRLEPTREVVTASQSISLRRKPITIYIPSFGFICSIKRTLPPRHQETSRVAHISNCENMLINKISNFRYYSDFG